MKECLGGLIDVLAKYKPEQARAYFHYCSKGVLNEFLKPDGEIFCTHTLHLNDDKEIIEGCAHYLDFLGARKGFSVSVIQMLRNNINENIARFDPRALDLPNVMPWTFSVSEADDSPYQWKHYVGSRTGGYRLAFKTDQLENAIAAVNKANAQLMLPVAQREILVFLPCLYLGYDDPIIEAAFDAAYNDFKDDFDKVRVSAPERECDAISGIRVLTTIFFVASLIKRGKFRHEREWRLILHATDEVKSHHEIIGGKSRLRTFLSTGISGRLSDMICQIMCSPQGDEKSLTRHAQLLLQQHRGVLHVHRSRIHRSVVDNYIDRIPFDDEYEDYVVDMTMAEAATPVVSQEEWALQRHVR